MTTPSSASASNPNPPLRSNDKIGPLNHENLKNSDRARHFLAAGPVSASNNQTADNSELGDQILSDPTIARVDSIAREIPGGRMPTAAIPMSLKKLSRLPFMEGHRFAM